MKFNLAMESEDAEATDAPRLLVERALKAVAQLVDNTDRAYGVIFDGNGNPVGEWQLTGEWEFTE